MNKARAFVFLPGILAAGAILNGCITGHVPVVSVTAPVTPLQNEFIVVDDVFVIADASGSMYLPDRYLYEKQLVRSFVNGMPVGPYDAGLVCFGGEYKGAWVWQPFMPFNRDIMQQTVEQMYWISGSTPLDEALNSIEPMLAERQGNAALVIFSDGEASPNLVLDALRRMMNTHHGRLCVYVVHFGDSARGEALLESMSTLALCGRLVEPVSITEEAGMQAFVREVFFGGMAGTAVVRVGDSDGDGVPDDKDACPNTPLGAKVDERGCWTLSGLYFDSGKSYIKQQYAYVIDEAAVVLKRNPGVRIQIDGHTDSSASERFNEELAMRRAITVRDAFVERGIEPARFEVRAYGESRPIADNSTASGMARNRRVELTPIG
jgi:OOP family OmpA-OmpF porin